MNIEITIGEVSVEATFSNSEDAVAFVTSVLENVNKKIFTINSFLKNSIVETNPVSNPLVASRNICYVNTVTREISDYNSKCTGSCFCSGKCKQPTRLSDAIAKKENSLFNF